MTIHLRTKKLSIINALRDEFKSYPGAKIEVKNFEQGPPIVAPVEVRLFGDNLDSLRVYAGQIETLLKQTEGTIYVNNPVSNLKSDIRVVINQDKARMSGINTVDIDRTVRLAVAGLDMGNFSDAEGEDFDIYLTTPKKERATLASLGQSLCKHVTRGTSTFGTNRFVKVRIFAIKH